MLHNGGENEQWPTSGHTGHITLAVCMVPNASQWEDKVGKGPQVGRWAAKPLLSRGSPTL